MADWHPTASCRTIVRNMRQRSSSAGEALFSDARVRVQRSQQVLARAHALLDRADRLIAFAQRLLARDEADPDALPPGQSQIRVTWRRGQRRVPLA